MSENLGNFFKLIAEDKKNKKEEMKELVGEVDIDSIFSQVKESIVEDKKQEEERQKQVLNSFENFLTKKIEDIEEIKEEIKEEIVVEEPVEEVVEEEVVEEVVEDESLVEKSLGLLSEPSEVVNADQNFATLEDLQKHYREFLGKIQQQLSTLGGGGIEDAPKTGGPYVRQNQAWSDLGSLDIIKGTTGYEFTGAFVERTTGQSGSNDIGTDYEYTQELADSQTWKRFGFSTSQQLSLIHI